MDFMPDGVLIWKDAGTGPITAGTGIRMNLSGGRHIITAGGITTITTLALGSEISGTIMGGMAI